MNRLVLHREAENEFVDSLVYHEQNWKQQGRSLYSEFRSVFEIIRSNPETHPLIEADIRFCKISSLPYSIIYQVLANEIWILAIAHDKRREGYWRKRKPTPEMT